ncbi:SDR family oxidoreductase, partial [Staphylococcus epidermidis]|uniref:SDR family oxidoreductase n=1 Tax=Staphylococcus epidermidis TaxID=1282 RepID=UPI00119EDFEE
FASLHVFLNNPPITKHNLLIPIKQQQSHHLIHTNLKPLFNSIQKLTPQIFPQPTGPIINLTTILRPIPNPPQPNYLPTKPALIPLTKTPTPQLPSPHITLNPLPPPFILSHITNPLTHHFNHQILHQIPLKPFPQHTHIPNTLPFLPSHKAKYITPQTIHV